ncbi:hypothetical protein ACCO45_004726 [Purpureocillium lilacinum]|uniref:Uncharacterized protein n=1 Tax=Purpureocillium lilacinum TaxID=33203 RepID=A0ACC4DVM6_PURLI
MLFTARKSAAQKYLGGFKVASLRENHEQRRFPNLPGTKSSPQLNQRPDVVRHVPLYGEYKDVFGLGTSSVGDDPVLEKPLKDFILPAFQSNFCAIPLCKVRWTLVVHQALNHLHIPPFYRIAYHRVPRAAWLRAGSVGQKKLQQFRRLQLNSNLHQAEIKPARIVWTGSFLQQSSGKAHASHLESDVKHAVATQRIPLRACTGVQKYHGNLFLFSLHCSTERSSAAGSGPKTWIGSGWLHVGASIYQKPDHPHVAAIHGDMKR